MKINLKSRKKQQQEEEAPTLNEFLEKEEELSSLKEQYGVEEKEGRISKAISHYFDKRDAKEKVCLNKRKYTLLLIFTGWMGGHRFYAKQYRVAILYLVLCWSGFPIAMSIIDLMIVIPMKADEDGNILM